MRRRGERDELAEELARVRQRVSELEAERRLLLRTDSVTGCLAVGSFRLRLGEEVERARRYRRPLSVALIELDGFRALQLRHGFAAGDALLVAVTETLRGSTRASDVLSRTAGQEFAVLLPETTAAAARECLERILLELEVLESGQINGIGASIGIAALDGDPSGEQLLDRAAEARDRARTAGGARLEFSSGRSDAVEATDGLQREAIEALAVALSERDRYTADHSESIVEMAGAVAQNLGVPPAEVDRIRAAALLHDIGKVAIPDAILHKPGPLDDREWQLMLEHPVVGERILRVVPGLGAVARIVRHEHERWDGKGYPDGLAGEDIPLGSRIILACDAYHAMTSDRPYRAAMPHADAMRELSLSAGSQFDPRVTAGLVGYLYGRRQAHPPATSV